MQTRSLLIVLQGALALGGGGGVERRAVRTIDFEAAEICTGTCAVGVSAQRIPDGCLGLKWTGFAAGRQAPLAQGLIPQGRGLGLVAGRNGSSFEVAADGAGIDPTSTLVGCALSTGTGVAPAISCTVRVRPSAGARRFSPPFRDCFFRVRDGVSVGREPLQRCDLPGGWRDVRKVTVSLQAAAVPSVDVLLRLGAIAGGLGLPPNIGLPSAYIDNVAINQQPA